ncbi:hypothetical protein [Occallatibacter savannae]|uniref:hypothetical protein n=1 Tax=Occallatibacter savannae TaxID=1002691 RepID=UPI0013A55DD1|nr:hypothetical protein [Occallatibacter savannae]
MPDTLGLAGLGLAVAGIGLAESPTTLRVSCLFIGALCLSVSFRTQLLWPMWTRWLLLVAADAILAYFGWSIASRG